MDQQTRALLKRWGHYDANIYDLSRADRLRMKVLYQSLKALDPHSVEILATKYRREKPLSDQRAAASLGIPESRFPVLRAKAQNEISRHVLRHYDAIDDELREAIRLDDEDRMTPEIRAEREARRWETMKQLTSDPDQLAVIAYIESRRS